MAEEMVGVDAQRKLQDRLGEFQKKDVATKKPGAWKVAALVAGSLALGGAAALGAKQGISALGESDVEAFQSGKTPERMKIDADAEQPDVLVAIPVAKPEEQPGEDPAMAELRQQLEDLKAKLAAKPAVDNSGVDQRVKDIEARLAEAERRADAADAALAAERSRQADDAAAAAAAAALAEADALEKAKIMAPAIVYGKGGGAGAMPDAAGGVGTDVPMQFATSPRQDAVALSPNEAYLRGGAQALVVAESSDMFEPNKTLAQGTMIQAAIETAITSDLPGNVLAMVTEPVPAFAGDAILIPKGSRLFGQYKSDVRVGQSRILILWTRILTPDGTSIEINSVGGDALGTSGLSGQVDKHFDERFGSAALISVIGAVPSAASAGVSNEVGSEVLGSVGNDLSDALGQSVADQINIGPTIYVDQGSAVTVMVDRDVVVR